MRIFLSLLIFLSSAVVAQESKLQSLLFGTDSTYAVRHPFRFTIRPNVGTTFGQYTSQWTAEDTPHSYSLMSSPIFKAGCSVSYLGITAGIHRDVKRLFGETEETEYSFSGYTPIVGGELSYSSSHTHTMSSNGDGETLWELPLSGCGIVRLGSVWDVEHYFGGFVGTMQMQWMSYTPIHTFDFYVRTRLFFGFRF